MNTTIDTGLAAETADRGAGVDSPGTPPPFDRPLSITQLRSFLRCGQAWHLRYQQGHLPRLGAGAWFGPIMHEAIRLAYRHALPLGEATWLAWKAAVEPALPDLVRLQALDQEYAAAGSARSKAAAGWRDQHPEYDALQIGASARRSSATTAAPMRWRGLSTRYCCPTRCWSKGGRSTKLTRTATDPRLRKMRMPPTMPRWSVRSAAFASRACQTSLSTMVTRCAWSTIRPGGHSRLTSYGTTGS